MSTARRSGRRGTGNTWDSRSDYSFGPGADRRNDESLAAWQGYPGDLRQVELDESDEGPFEYLLPISIKNGFPDFGPDVDPYDYREWWDDYSQDGFESDIMFIEIDADSQYGFLQEYYIFEEPEVFAPSITGVVPVQQGQDIKVVTVIIPNREPDGTVSQPQFHHYFIGTNEPDVALGTVNGDDQLSGADGDDILVGFSGHDRLFGDGGNDQLNGMDGDDRLFGGDGDDTVFGWADNDFLSGGAGDDELFGDAGLDELEGGAGHDFLDGGAGADEMRGGTEDDIYVVDDMGDRIIELANEGTDEVQTTLTYYLQQHLENLTLTGRDDIWGVGNNANNVVTGNDGNNRLEGRGGQDILLGGEGEDTLYGGSNVDTLTGGYNADKFQFFSPEDGGDTITDFNVSHGDVIFLWSIGFDLEIPSPIRVTLPNGPLASRHFVRSSHAEDADDYFIYERNWASGTANLYFDPDGNGNMAQQLVAHFHNNPSLGSSDIVLF